MFTEMLARNLRAHSVSQDGLVGKSPAFRLILERARMIAPMNVSVLLLGDSGTGKTELARYIHKHSDRKTQPFVELNCASLPSELLENELFGSAAGAHSTALVRHDGKIQAAEGGALFLDEIAELSPAAQAKLLQVLQSRTYYPLGSTKPRTADVRFLAATNADLLHLVKAGRFREDLYYRLNVVCFRLPSLDERREDLIDLAEHLVNDAAERHQLRALKLSIGARATISAAQWPGNIRQLSNVLECGLILASGENAAAIEARHLAGHETQHHKAAPDFREATKIFQRALLTQVLEESGGCIVEASRRLRITRSHVYNLMRSLGLERPRAELDVSAPNVVETHFPRHSSGAAEK